jgi:hypothetical protein
MDDPTPAQAGVFSCLSPALFSQWTGFVRFRRPGLRYSQRKFAKNRMAPVAASFSDQELPVPFRVLPMRRRWNLARWLGATAALAVAASVPANAAEPQLLVGSENYLNLRVSSVYGSGYGAEMLVDNDPNTAWVIAGIAGANPQGRDEAWISFDLSQDYFLSTLLFSPRGSSGSVDGLDKLQLWAALEPFAVDVTSKASTDAFLALQSAPILQVNGFADSVTLPYQYSLQSPLARHVLVRLENQTDQRASRNLGAKQLLLQVTEVVPAPIPATGIGFGWLWASRLRLRIRQASRVA